MILKKNLSVFQDRNIKQTDWWAKSVPMSDLKFPKSSTTLITYLFDYDALHVWRCLEVFSTVILCAWYFPPRMSISLGRTLRDDPLSSSLYVVENPRNFHHVLFKFEIHVTSFTTFFSRKQKYVAHLTGFRPTEFEWFCWYPCCIHVL